MLGLPRGGMLSKYFSAPPFPLLVGHPGRRCGAPCISLDLVVGPVGEKKQT